MLATPNGGPKCDNAAPNEIPGVGKRHHVCQSSSSQLRYNTYLVVTQTTPRHHKETHVQQVPETTVSLYCDISTGKPRPYVPIPLRLRVFRSIHYLSHPGTKSTAQLVAQRFVWPGVQKDCRSWARACPACQRSKVSRHTATLAGDFALPPARFLHIHIDL
jgi:hypothetical protein